MADNWIVVGDAAKPYTGRYPLVLPYEFNVRELGWAKRLADRLPADAQEGLEGLDAEMFLVLVLVAMHRVGKVQAADVPDVFKWLSEVDAPFMETFSLEGAPQEEDEADSPPPTSSDVNGGSSGHGSPTSSGRSGRQQSPIGVPASGSSQSVPATSAT